MKSRSRVFAFGLVFVASSIVSLGTPASAQQAPPPAGGGGAGGGMMGQGLNIDPAILLKAKVGAWADYSMPQKGGDEKPVTVRYALVEKTPAKLSLEIDSATPKGEMIVHLDFAPQGPDTWKAASGKVKMGEQAMDIPAAQLAGAAPLKTGAPPGDLVGSETITTPVGTFPCKHYKMSIGDPTSGKGANLDMWFNDKVMPTGLVKTSIDAMGRTIQMTLQATGNGAQAKLH